ncbi:MAG: mechanosensitive ion channel [Bdellovibrionales bacterium]|nr:mechanosensitive ion channel [Bdellovibrionales bacterium]
MGSNRIRTLLRSLAVFLVVSGAGAAPSSTPPSPIRLGDREIAVLSDQIGSFSSAERAKAATDRIESFTANRVRDADAIQAVDSDQGTNIVAGDTIFFTFTDADAKAIGKPRAEAAGNSAVILRDAIRAEREVRSDRSLLVAGGKALASTLALALILFLFGRFFPAAERTIFAWKGTVIPSIRVKGLEILGADRIAKILAWLLQTTRLITTLLLIYFYVPLVLSFFPWTANFAPKLYGYLWKPVKVAGDVVLGYAPNLLFIALIAVGTRYLLKFVRFVFSEIGAGTITFSGFHRDWVDPTYKLVRLLILALALVVMFPYLPGSGSPAFQGVSVFLGLLLSFGSSSAIANIVAGIVLTYMRPFRVGDRVKIADTMGDVTEKSLLVTRVRTIKNVEITVPNSLVLGNHIVNYSAEAAGPGLILNTSVTIGYDAPWKTVHALLIEAAKKTGAILKDPAPFVFQTSLDDFYVSYELNAYTREARRMAAIYSELHQNIQDAFNSAGVEIMSPHYAAHRDGNATSIPADHLPKDYRAPRFRVTLDPPNG